MPSACRQGHMDEFNNNLVPFNSEPLVYCNPISKLINTDISGAYAKVPGNNLFRHCRGTWGKGVECAHFLSREKNLCHIWTTKALNVRFTISSPL